MRINSAAVASLAFMASAGAARAFGVSLSRTARRSGRAAAARRVPLAMVSTSTDDATTTSSPASSGSANPMLDQEGLPRFSSIEPSHLTPAVSELLEKLDADFVSMETKLSSDGEATKYDDVLPEVERIQQPLGYVWGVAGHLNGVKNGEELREAYEKNQPGVVRAMTKFSQSRPLYDALKGIEKSWADADDDDVEFAEGQRRRAVSNSLRSMTLGGVGLEGEDKVRFNDMKMRLAELATKFGNNVLDATKAYALTVEDPADVEGVPASARAMWAQAHVAHLKTEDPEAEVPDEADPEKGPWRVTLDGPSYIAAMSHLPNRSQREAVYRAFITRASDISDPEKDNTPLIYEILELKHEMANMLGFDNYAEMSLAQKMAPTVEAVTELTDLIADKALPAARRELDEVTELARSEGGEQYSEGSLEKLMPWDVTFWSERLKEKKFDLTEEELRPYFALPAVLDGMFGLVRRIFGVEVTAADGEAEVWHPDVRFFHVNDIETGKHIASFYLDPYSRPADKRGGAWMDVCIGKSEACKRDVPVAYLTCNGSPPVGDTPSLMAFREVETLFHEFGHGLQHMLTTATVGDVAGINGVEWDAVELPSQFMENWCYDRPTVYGFARHHETGEPLPEDMFEKLKEQKTYAAGMTACRQLYFGQMDMELHSTFDPEAAEKGEGETVFDVQRRVAHKYQPHNPPLPDDRFLCAFGHIFGGGYAAGYYSYKWAEVMSADAFGAFEDAGLDDNEDEVREVGRRFRDTVLSLGGGVEPMEVFRRFRGREPTPDALLRHNGLA